jgi:hypothetical protein
MTVHAPLRWQFRLFLVFHNREVRTMKRKIIPLLAFVALSMLGCGIFLNPVKGSGFPKTIGYALTDFSRVEAGNAFNVRIVPDAAYSVQITCDDNLDPYLVVTQDNGTLKITLKDFNYYYDVILSAEVHVPALTGVNASGASDIRIESGFPRVQSMSISASGASNITLAQLTATSINADVSGASTLTVSGAVGIETLVVSGASDALLIDCAAGSADVQISGASEAWVDAGNGVITLSASGASTFYYRGNPVFHNLDLSGASGIQKVN